MIVKLGRAWCFSSAGCFLLLLMAAEPCVAVQDRRAWCFSSAGCFLLLLMAAEPCVAVQDRGAWVLFNIDTGNLLLIF
ncbi:hypothetical protein [Kingella denitrificans]|uniref:hypothetical protein n=1 Tax=Kingella denitrificans TaxID=502 RepID=UPI0011D05C61|nr:hypothetical protein [Kingella denitrificans]